MLKSNFNQKTSSVKIINVTELKSSNSSLKTRMSNIENRCNCTTDLRWTRNCKIVDKNNCLECEVETCMIIEMQEDTYCSILKCVSLLTTTTFKPITHSPVPPAHHEDMTKYIILGILLFICIVVCFFAICTKSDVICSSLAVLKFRMLFWGIFV